MVKNEPRGQKLFVYIWTYIQQIILLVLNNKKIVLYILLFFKLYYKFQTVFVYLFFVPFNWMNEFKTEELLFRENLNDLLPPRSLVEQHKPFNKSPHGSYGITLRSTLGYLRSINLQNCISNRNTLLLSDSIHGNTRVSTIFKSSSLSKCFFFYVEIGRQTSKWHTWC